MRNELGLLMEENLAQVWGERNASNRLKATQTKHTADSILHRVGYQTTGHEAINESVSKVLANLPAAFTFFKHKPVVIDNNIGRLI